MNMIFIGYFQSTGDETLDNQIADRFYQLGYWVEPDYCWEENQDENAICIELDLNMNQKTDRL